MHSDQESSVGTGGTEPQQDLKVYPGLRYSPLVPDPSPLPFSLYWKYDFFFKFKLGHFSHRLFAEYLMRISYIPCLVHLVSCRILPSYSPPLAKLSSWKTLGGGAQFNAFTVQFREATLVPIHWEDHKHIESSFIFVIRVSGVALVITDTVAWLGGPGVSVYISVCVCVCVCVFAWRGWD